MEKVKKLPQLQSVAILRAFAILAVVLNHCYSPFFKAWDWYPCELSSQYSFIFDYVLAGRMPLFFFISGYLFSHLVIDRGKYTSFKGFLENKLKRLLLPCVIFIGIMSLTLQEDFFHQLFFYGFHLWFLKVLFVCFIVCWLCNRYVKNTKAEVAVWMLSFLMMAGPMIQFWALGQFFKKFVFFYTGYLIYKHRARFPLLFNKKGLILFSICFISLTAIGFYLYSSYGWDNSIDYREPIAIKTIEILIMGFATIALVFTSVNVFLANNPDFKPVFLATINNLSYGIYLLHVYLLQTMHMYANDLIEPFFLSYSIFSPILLFVAVTLLSIAITKCIKKFKYGYYIVG